MVDYINPTGGKIRGSDRHGQGHYGASRGSRKHIGVDYSGESGQDVKAIMSGKITKVGYPYGNDLSYRYVEITKDEYRVRQYYTEPYCKKGDTVAQGDVIGTLQGLDRRYEGITEHCHVEIYHNGVIIDPTELIKD